MTAALKVQPELPIQAGSGLEILAELVDEVRNHAIVHRLPFYSRSWTTLDGSVTIDYVPECMVRVTFTGDAAARSHVLPHDWPA